MPTWHAKINVKDLFDDDLSNENVERIADVVYGRLMEARNVLEDVLNLRLVGVPDMDSYDDIADEFHSIKVCSDDRKHAWFNSLLEELYDWADDHRVWIGP